MRNKWHKKFLPVRTHKQQKEVKLHFIRKKFQTQEVQNLKLESCRKPQLRTFAPIATAHL